MATFPKGNLLLDHLSHEAFASLRAEAIHAATGDVLIEADTTPEFAFFPHPDTVVSIVRGTDEGIMVEAGLVGFEGVVNVQTIIAPPEPTRSEAIIQLGSDVTRVRLDVARAAFAAHASFRDGVLAVTNNLLHQITQNAVCNRLHKIEQRLSKWLLVARDRFASDELHLTHDFLAQMLGIHRPGVSIAIDALEVDGLIAHARNRITLRDREGLLARTCECYGVVHESLRTLRATLAPPRQLSRIGCASDDPAAAAGQQERTTSTS